MSFFIPVDEIDNELLEELIDIFEQFHEESEIIAIQLEQHPEKIELLSALRYLFEGLLYKTVKLNFTPVSESLSNAVSLLDHLLEWKVFPPQMSQYLLLLVDRMLMLINDIVAVQAIDMRKAQQVLVSLEKILAIDVMDNISDAALSGVEALTCDYVDQYGGDIELFNEISCVYASPDESHYAAEAPVIIHDVMHNPILQARDWVENEFKAHPISLLNNISEASMSKGLENAYDMIELCIATNIIAGEPLNNFDLAIGISFRDVALAEIPHIINKKEKLSDQEFAMIQKHPLRGASLLRLFHDAEQSAQVVMEHHERINGTGYPFGLKGDNISDAGKLVGITDSFHGMVRNRPHKRHSKGVIRAISEINASTEILYDVFWVKQFNTCLRKYWMPLEH